MAAPGSGLGGPVGIGAVMSKATWPSSSIQIPSSAVPADGDCVVESPMMVPPLTLLVLNHAVSVKPVLGESGLFEAT